ncbi:hypothetical protein KCU85_g3200, partial [Aureobasidium melanogenum]
MFQPTETQHYSANASYQRLTKPQTRHNSACLGKAETSSTKATPINAPNDNAEDARMSLSNDSPLSFTGSTSFRNSESPSRSATNLHSEGTRSRKASTTSMNTTKRHTIAVDNSDVDVAAAIALLQELKKRASPEDLILLHKALLPTKNVERTIAPSKPESREYEEPISPLIRRSSLLPAGVKTRLSRELLRNYSENNVTVRSASVSRQHDAVESPRLDVPLDFEALDLAEGGTELQGGRPTTPSEFYPQIGTYKMGSLRITNGAASPEPARLLKQAEMTGIQHKPSVPESLSGEGFTTADEGENTPECVRPSHATVVSLRAPRRSSEQQDRKLSSELRARSKSRGRPVRHSTETEAKKSAYQPTRPQVTQLASEYAQEYVSEFDSLENPHMSNAALTTTVSRLSTVHDESPVEGDIDAREEALRQLTGDVLPVNDSMRKAQSQKHLHVARPPMTKSDSGYSSEASRRSIVKESNCDEFLLAALGAADQAEHSRSKESLTAAAARPSLEQIQEDKVSSPAPYVQQQVSAVQKAERHRSLPSFFFKKSSSSTSVNTIATTPVTPVKQTRKLQKTRPRSQIIIPEQVQEPEPEPMLPEIEPEFNTGTPEDLSVNFSRPTRRLERGPSASPQQTQEEDERDARGRGRSRKNDVTSQTANAGSSPDGTTRKRSRSFFRFRSRSRSKSQHRHEEDITVLSVADEPLPTHDFSDFGTVAQSLGQSPYDIATRRVKQMGAYDPSKPWFHPHEISRAAPKPDLSSETQQSREKSVERGRQDRARSQSRPRESIDAVLTNSRPPTRGKSRRSQSAHNIAVPRVPEAVPELPKQTQRMSGTFSRSVSKDGTVRVGTIDFGTGFAQGRLEPILTSSEKAKTRRRTQSVAPRARPRSTVNPDEVMPQREMPQPARMPSGDAPKSPARELPPTPTEKPSQGLPLELPQIPSRAPPKVPAHGKQPSNMHPVLSVSTKPVHLKEPTTVPHSPASPGTPTGRPSWESQALAWRERKQSLNDMLSSPTTERKSGASNPASPAIQAYSPTMQAPRRAPTVVVSRYITPQGSEFAMHLGEEGPYRKLHSDNSHKKYRSEDPYKKFHSDNPTDLRPAQEDVERTDSSSTYRTATSEQSQDSFASKDSAKCRTYRPVEDAAREKPSAPPTPKSNSTQKRSSRILEQPQPRPQRRSTAPPENQDVPFDRFSGGLGYGWERGVGFGGSAGTRQKNDTKAARKSVADSQTFGVDLSDIPVFMVRS